MPENSGSKWDHYFLRLAKEAASMSKDPSTKVGAVIVDQDRNVVATEKHSSCSRCHGKH
jgi:dCMP deaminase